MGFAKKFIRSLGYSAFIGGRRRYDELQGELQLAKQAVKHKIRDWKEQEKVILSLEKEIAKLGETIRREQD